MKYVPQTSSLEQPVSLSFTEAEIMRLFAKFNEVISEPFAQGKMEVRPARTPVGEDMRRIIMVSKDRLHYKVLKINEGIMKPPKDEADEDIPMS